MAGVRDPGDAVIGFTKLRNLSGEPLQVLAIPFVRLDGVLVELVQSGLLSSVAYPFGEEIWLVFLRHIVSFMSLSVIPPWVFGPDQGNDQDDQHDS
jgi:hypothetical protein